MSCSSPVRSIASAVALLALCFTASAAVESGLIPGDISRLQRIDSISVSPDGGMVACAVLRTCSGAGNDSAAHRQLWLQSLVASEAEPVRLTTGIRDDRHPVFAPDSKDVAFYRLDALGRHQTHVIATGGGEPRALASLPAGVDASLPPVWSPDGRMLLVTGWIEPPDVPGPLVARIGDAPLFMDPRSPRRGLWILDASGAERTPFGPLPGFQDCSDGVFSGDGRTIYCTVVLPDEPEPGFARRTAIGRIGLGDKMVPSDPAIAFEDPDFDLWSPRVSPSGEVIAVLGQSRRAPLFEPRRLGIFQLDGAEGSSPSWLTGEAVLDREVVSFQWRVGQDVLLLNALDDGGIDLLTISRTLLSQPRILVEHEEDLPVGISAFSSGGGAIAMVRCAVDSPSELWVLDARGLQRIWNPNRWLDGIDVAMPKAGWVTPRGEDPIPYWLFLPAGAADRDRLPIVTWLGDGPGAMLGPGVFEDWFPTQLLVANGFAVLQVNPRGSAGYGRAVRRGAFRDFIRGPSRDVFAVLQSVRQEDQRLGAGGDMLIGRGFGGLIATWMMAAMPAIDAAVIEDGVFSVATALAEHQDWPLLRELLGGVPQDPGVLSITRDIDPAAHVDRIGASVLLMTGSSGGFVTTHGTNLMYRMLSLGYKDVQLVVYEANADAAACEQQVDRFERILNFLRQHVDASEAP